MGMAGQGGAACPNDEPVMTKRILLIVSGGIAAYKSLELVRLLRRRGIAVRAVLTESAQQLVTPLSLGVLSADRVYGDKIGRASCRERVGQYEYILGVGVQLQKNMISHKHIRNKTSKKK